MEWNGWGQPRQGGLRWDKHKKWAARLNPVSTLYPIQPQPCTNSIIFPHFAPTSYPFLPLYLTLLLFYPCIIFEYHPHIDLSVKVFMFASECEVSVSKLLGFETSRFWNFFHFLDGFGFGIERIWYRKKYQIRYCKDFVSEKVSDSVSEKFRIWFCLDFGFFGWCFGFKTSWF